MLLPFLGTGQDLGNGFFDHGVACPVSNHRGTVATVDGNGRNVVLAWLFDHRGGYALLMIDAETGKSEQFLMPFTPGDAPYSSLLSSRNKYYTLFKNNFVEFDPVKRSFTFHKESLPQMAMGFTEDDHGLIWAVTYPNSGVISFDPVTRVFKDYGYQYQQNWKQYPKSMAADDKGWLYFAVGSTASQIIAFNPSAAKAIPLLPEAERKRGQAFVYRNMDGKVYGQALKDKGEQWFRFYEGKKTAVAKHDPSKAKPVITGNQDLFHRNFPDGKILVSLDLQEKKLTVKDAVSNAEKTVDFDYSSEGALVMGVGAAPNGTIVGGAAFPMRFFSFNPKEKTIRHLPAYGQFNAMAGSNDRFYFGVYPQGALLEWNPSSSWINTRKEVVSNPQWLAASVLSTHRPHRILATADNNTIIMSGTPEYGYTGGGLLLWNKKRSESKLLTDSMLIQDQSTMSMVSLPGNKIAGGTTTMPGTGGEKKAKEAELYILNLVTNKIEWHAALLPGVQDYSDLYLGKNGLIYGIADLKIFFVFDPQKKQIIHQENVEEKFGKTAWAQSPRIFVKGKNEECYILFAKGIVQVDNRSYTLAMIAESPVPVETGGDYLDGKIYFVSGSHLCSFQTGHLN